MNKSAKVSQLSPQRGTVALLHVDEHTHEVLRGHLSSGYQIEVFESHEPLLSALGLGSLKLDVVIIGAETETALEIALSVRKVVKSMQIIVLAEIRNVDALRKRAEIQSADSDEMTIWPSQHLEDLPDVIRKAVKRSHRRVRANEEGNGGDDSGNGGGSADATSHLTRLLEHAPIGILTLNDAGEIKTLNKQARVILGVQPGNLIDRPVYEFFPVGEQKRLRRLLRGAAEQRDEEKNRVFRVEGDPPRHVEVIVADDEAGSDRPRTMVILHDVTSIVRAQQAQRRTAAALQASEDRFNELADAMRMVPWEADPTTFRVTYIGERIEEVMGYAPSQWLSRTFWIDRLHPEDRRAALERLRRDARRLQNFDIQFRMLDRDGNVKTVRNIVNVVRDQHGMPERIRGFLVDIDRDPNGDGG